MKTIELNVMGGTSKNVAEALDHAEAQLSRVAVLTAPERRNMAAEVFVLMINDTDSALTPNEIQEVWREAVCQKWTTPTATEHLHLSKPDGRQSHRFRKGKCCNAGDELNRPTSRARPTALNAARVSTDDQNADIQRAALKKDGVSRSW